MRLLSLVGRTRFELVTNGLKARYATGAEYRFTVRKGCLAGLETLFLPRLCQILPT